MGFGFGLGFGFGIGLGLGLGLGLGACGELLASVAAMRASTYHLATLRNARARLAGA